MIVNIRAKDKPKGKAGKEVAGVSLPSPQAVDKGKVLVFI